jgi:hypothetical protein
MTATKGNELRRFETKLLPMLLDAAQERHDSVQDGDATHFRRQATHARRR